MNKNNELNKGSQLKKGEGFCFAYSIGSVVWRFRENRSRRKPESPSWLSIIRKPLMVSYHRSLTDSCKDINGIIVFGKIRIITRADYAGDLEGNGKNAVSFGIQANADTDIYITATYFRDYGRFLFIFDERTAAVSPEQQNAGRGSAAGINPYAANDIVIYDIPTEVYTMFRSEDGFREASYVYLTAQGIYTDTVVAGEWYEINGDTASFVLEAQGRTIQATYDAVRDLYTFS